MKANSPIRYITSRHNPHMKKWLSLLNTQGITRHQECLVSGKRLGQELIQHASYSIQEILLPAPEAIHDVWAFHGPIFALSTTLFQELDVFGTKAPLVVSRIPILSDCDLGAKPKGLEVLCPMGDPGNLGAFLRGCLAFGVNRVILLNESVHPFHPKVIRASSGAVFFLTIAKGCSIKELASPAFSRWITGLDLNGEDLTDWAWPKDLRLLIGEEGLGLPGGAFAHRLNIPQVRTSIPLNAAAAGQIALFAYRQQHPSHF